MRRSFYLLTSVLFLMGCGPTADREAVDAHGVTLEAIKANQETLREIARKGLELRELEKRTQDSLQELKASEAEREKVLAEISAKEGSLKRLLEQQEIDLFELKMENATMEHRALLAENRTPYLEELALSMADFLITYGPFTSSNKYTNTEKDARMRAMRLELDRNAHGRGTWFEECLGHLLTSDVHPIESDERFREAAESVAERYVRRVCSAKEVAYYLARRHNAAESQQIAEVVTAFRLQYLGLRHKDFSPSLSLDFVKTGSTPESVLKPTLERDLASLERTRNTLTELIALRDAAPAEVQSEFTDFIRKDATEIGEVVKLVLEECNRNARTSEAFVPILTEITNKLTALLSD
ncbi:MAG: hypothetical protein ACYC4B_29710 [Pirellulaceae bacterium]